MKEKILVSVLLPAFNSEKYLSDAITSIFNQSYSNFELIIINDGSTDQTAEIVKSFKDSRIKYYENEQNKGLIFSLNKGIDLCKGKYIVRMDADDISFPERIKKQVEYMEQYPEVGVAGSWFIRFGKGAQKKFRVSGDHEILRSMLLFNSCLCHPSVIIRKSVLTANNLKFRNEYKHAEDYDLWVELSKVSKLGNLQDYLLKYRMHASQVSSAHNQHQRSTAELIRRNFLSHLGFELNEAQLKVHSIIGNNLLITSMNTLEDIEKYLNELIRQNTELKKIDVEKFNFRMGNLWCDSCGNTNLGRAAYKAFFNSPLEKYFPLSAAGKAKLAAKCVVRKFTK
jgi:glycosyltransferase involved in cell wall biosynthesis